MTIAKALAHKLAAVYLRIDTLEQALLQSEKSSTDIGPAGYLAGYAVAADNLRLWSTVIAGSANSLNIIRRSWRKVTLENSANFFEIELVCSDKLSYKCYRSPKSDQTPMEGLIL